MAVFYHDEDASLEALRGLTVAGYPTEAVSMEPFRIGDAASRPPLSR